jgi:hypothetical protein
MRTLNNGSGKQGVNPASLPASAPGGAEARGHHPEHEHSSPRLRATGRWRRELESVPGGGILKRDGVPFRLLSLSRPRFAVQCWHSIGP